MLEVKFAIKLSWPIGSYKSAQNWPK